MRTNTSANATVHLSTGLSASASAHATEIYAAFDACREKMDKQLRRYKRRLKDHHLGRSEPVEFGAGSAYILAASEGTEDAEPDTLQPMIIAEMETKIPSLSVGEAVMQMELSESRLLVFRNETAQWGERRISPGRRQYRLDRPAQHQLSAAKAPDKDG